MKQWPEAVKQWLINKAEAGRRKSVWTYAGQRAVSTEDVQVEAINIRALYLVLIHIGLVLAAGLLAEADWKVGELGMDENLKPVDTNGTTMMVTDMPAMPDASKWHILYMAILWFAHLEQSVFANLGLFRRFNGRQALTVVAEQVGMFGFIAAICYAHCANYDMINGVLVPYWLLTPVRLMTTSSRAYGVKAIIAPPDEIAVLRAMRQTEVEQEGYEQASRDENGAFDVEVAEENRERANDVLAEGAALTHENHRSLREFAELLPADWRSIAKPAVLVHELRQEVPGVGCAEAPSGSDKVVLGAALGGAFASQTLFVVGMFVACHNMPDMQAGTTQNHGLAVLEGFIAIFPLAARFNDLRQAPSMRSLLATLTELAVGYSAVMTACMSPTGFMATTAFNLYMLFFRTALPVSQRRVVPALCSASCCEATITHTASAESTASSSSKAMTYNTDADAGLL